MNYKYLLISIVYLFAMVSCEKKDQSEIGDEYYKEGKYEKAIAAYNEFLELKPSNEIALYNRGRAYEELGKYEQSLADFKAVLEINPKSENAYLSIGKDYYRRSDYENAAFQFEMAYKLNNKNTQAALLFARANHKAGEIDLAMEYYNIAINLDSDLAEAYLYRGALKIYLKQGNNGCADLRQAKNLGNNQAEDLLKEYCG